MKTDKEIEAAKFLLNAIGTPSNPRPSTKIEHTCAKCGYEFNTASDAKGEDAKPRNGSFSICINCAAIGVFQEDLSLVPFSDEEFAALEPYKQRQLRKAQDSVRAYQALKARKKKEAQ